MEEMLIRAQWFATGVVFCTLIVGAIWGRKVGAFLKASWKREDLSEMRESRALAILETVHREDIKEFSDDIRKTTELRRSRPLDG